MKKLIMMIIIMLSIFAIRTEARAEEGQAPQIVKEATALTEDTVWSGDFYVKEDIDLNGFTLTIEGNLILGKGIIQFHGGKLLVDGDFRIQAIKSKREDVPYQLMKEEDFQYCSGALRMDQSADYLLVEGNFYPNGKDNTLRNGTVELKGDFMFITQSYADCYDTIGNHKTIFSGTEDQRVFFARSGSQFNILQVHKKTGEMIFESSVDIAAIDEDTTIPVGGNGYMYLYLYTNKVFSLQGHTLTIDGTLFFERGSLNIDGGTLIVTEDLRIEKIKKLDDVIDVQLDQLAEEDFMGASQDTQLVMEKDEDLILVEGNFRVWNYAKFKKLRAGVLEIKGDVYQIGNKSMLTAYDTHKVLLSGEKKQTVSFERPSYTDHKTKKTIEYSNFNILEIKNRYVTFATEYKPGKNRSIYWQKKLIPFVLHVNYNEKAVKFKKHSPIVVKGVFYFEMEEANQLLGTKLAYNSKAKKADGKFGKKNLSVKTITNDKVNYVAIEELLEQMEVEYNYEAGTQTLFIVN